MLVLNVAAVLYWARPRDASGRLTEPQSPLVVTQYVEKVVAGERASGLPPSSAEAFHWSHLEAAEYRDYIVRLRKIGCPEQTIRDLVIADVDKLFAARMRSIVPWRATPAYWESEDADLANNHDARQWERKEREIEREKARILKELLGVDLAAERMRVKGQVDKMDRRLAFLPEEKRSELRTLLETWEDQEQTIRERSWDSGQALTESERTQLRTLREQKELGIGSVLSPEQKELFDLWMSPTAESLRHDLYGMGTSEQEFRDLYELRREFDQQWPRDEIDVSDENTLRAWGQALLDLEEQIKTRLGEEKFSMYQRGQDHQFHDLSAVASRFNLPRHRAAEAYEYLRLARMEKQRLADSGAYSPEQLSAIHARVDAEVERALSELLGAPAFAFLRANGRQ
ncbi:MAG: hypothetical protein FJ405_13810 [Verrucomicrobia bacterium]|nr:hypothetical protein [Verrucomicrobiota bacterium]